MQAKSRKGHTVDALAYSGDEGRAKLRKAAGSCKEALIRGYPNGATHPDISVLGYLPSNRGRRTRGTETSKYPEDKKTIVISQVVASERESAQTSVPLAGYWGCRTTLSKPE
jgi:hypothetical protein